MVTCQASFRTLNRCRQRVNVHEHLTSERWKKQNIVLKHIHKLFKQSIFNTIKANLRDILSHTHLRFIASQHNEVCECVYFISNTMNSCGLTGSVAWTRTGSRVKQGVSACHRGCVGPQQGSAVGKRENTTSRREIAHSDGGGWRVVLWRVTHRHLFCWAVTSPVRLLLSAGWTSSLWISATSPAETR